MVNYGGDDLDFGDVGSQNSVAGVGGVSPLLVDLYDCHKQYAVQNSIQSQDNAVYRDAVCKQMADILSVATRVSDREMITDVLVTLIRQSERDLKAALSERLAIIPDIPLRLVLQLINDDISVAKPIILNSPVLNDLDLIYIIQSRDTSFWQAIAARQYIKENVVDALASTNDVPTAKVLAENNTVTFSNFALRELEKMAKVDPDLAQPLLVRDDIPAEFARKIHAIVGQDIVDMIDVHAGQKISLETAEKIQETVSDVVNEFSVSKNKSDGASFDLAYMPTEAMLRAADMFMAQGKLDKILLLRTLKRGQLASFVAQLSSFAGLDAQTIMMLLKQENGQGLAIISRASGLPKEYFMAMFTLTRKIAHPEGLVTSENLSKASLYFDRINSHLAKKILKRSQH